MLCNGYYYDDGSPVYYYNDGDTKIISTAWPYTSIHDDNYLSVGFEITNNTTSPLPFGFANIEADGLKQAKNKLKKMDIRIYSAKDADKEWKTADYYEIMNEIPDNAGQALGRSASRAAFDSGVSAGASLGLLAAGLLLNTISEPDSEPYMKEKNEERERLMKSYLADTVINPGDTLSTFVSMKLYGVPACVNVYLKLNGETYTFNY